MLGELSYESDAAERLRGELRAANAEAAQLRTRLEDDALQLAAAQQVGPYSCRRWKIPAPDKPPSCRSKLRAHAWCCRGNWQTTAVGVLNRDHMHAGSC